MQLLSDKAPVDAAYVPDWHFVHSAAPIWGEYVPTGHCVHVVDPVEFTKVPIGHGEQQVAPAAEKEPAGHGCLSLEPPEH